MSEDRLALVTGASRGLGYQVAKALGAAGWHVIALARTVGGLEDLDNEIRRAGGTATLVPLDLTDDPGLSRMGLAIHERWGGLDLLVHCAAHAVALSPAGHVSEKDFDRAMAVNGRATLRLIAVADPLLRARGGEAVHCDDRASGAFHAAYAASKAAARAVMEAWAEESRRTGPRVRLFTPPPMPTALRARFHPGEDRARLADPAAVAADLLGPVLAQVPVRASASQSGQIA